MDSARNALVGLGNPYHGDDAIGLIVARHLYSAMDHHDLTDLLELSTCGFALMEQLLGYDHAVIVDALVDDQSELGTVKRVPVPEAACESRISFHSNGFGAALALARLLGLPVPKEIAMYGIVILDPWSFDARLTAEIEARLPRIIETLRAHLSEMSSGDSQDVRYQ